MSGTSKQLLGALEVDLTYDTDSDGMGDWYVFTEKVEHNGIDLGTEFTADQYDAWNAAIKKELIEEARDASGSAKAKAYFAAKEAA